MKSERQKNRYGIDRLSGPVQGSSLAVMAALLLAACDGTSVGGATNNGGGTANNGGGAGGSVIASPKLAADDADTLIKESMLGYYTSTNNTNAGGGGLVVDADIAFIQETSASVADTDSSASDTGGEARFSDTNVQEAGVDESDRVKIDGSVMFALEKTNSQFYGVFPVDAVPLVAESDEIQGLSIPYPGERQVETLSAYRLAKENSSTMTRMKLELGNQTAEGMYLHKKGSERDLVLISKQTFDTWRYWGNVNAFSGLKTRVTWIDASDETNLTMGRTLDVDGQLISSRKIDNKLIVVTRFHPQLDGIVVPYTEDVAQSNRTKIEAADVSDLLPGYELTVNGNTTRGSVVSDNRCYKSERPQPTENSGGVTADEISPYYVSPSVISIMTIDLNDQSTTIKNTCFIGESETMYVSRNALYLATTEYKYSVGTDSLSRPMVPYYPPQISTEIHKFSLKGSGAPEFRGSGSVSGHLGWYTERKPYRMSEKDNNLRVVTFDENRSGSPVTLNILAEGSGANMTTLSTLPNDDRPAPIGKPGENLYASRFMGDRAYLVTFRVTDPLYVLDVSDPYDPLIAGELELPGYSDYLHPVTEDLLVGVGKDAIAADGSGWGDGRGAWYQGVKLALFDVSDSTNPFVADSVVIGKRGTDTPALYQPHSFTWLPQGNGRNARMAMPLSLHDGQPRESAPWAWSDWTSNNMLKMEVDVGARSFVDVPDWTFETRAAGHTSSPVTLQDDRAVIGTDGGLYVIHNGALQYGQWVDAAPIATTP